MRRWRAGRVRPAGIQFRWRSSSLSRRRMLGRLSVSSRSGMEGLLPGCCEGGRGHYRASACPLWGGCAPHAPIRDEPALRAALAHPPTLGILFCGGFAPTPPSGLAGGTRPRGRASVPLWGLRPHAPVRTGRRDAASRAGVRPSVGAAPPRPRPDWQAGRGLEGGRPSLCGGCAPTPPSGLAGGTRPRGRASVPLWGLRLHAPSAPSHPRGFRGRSGSLSPRGRGWG